MDVHSKARLQATIDEAALATGIAARTFLPEFRARVEHHARALARTRNPLLRWFHRHRLARASSLVAEAIEDIETARAVRTATRNA